MAWWALDLAARQVVPWVRRHAQVPQVVAYNQPQGFALLREEQRIHTRLYMLARKAERLDLSSWLGTGFREGTPVPPDPGDHLDQLRPRVLGAGAVSSSVTAAFRPSGSISPASIGDDVLDRRWAWPRLEADCFPSRLSMPRAPVIRGQVRRAVRRLSP
jgi:hypothetical protein